MFVVLSSLSPVTLKDCVFQCVRHTKTDNYSLCLSVQSNRRRDVAVRLATFQFLLFLKAPNVLFSPRPTGLKGEKKVALFFWILTQDNRPGHLLFCSASAELERCSAIRRVLRKCFQFLFSIFYRVCNPFKKTPTLTTA